MADKLTASNVQRSLQTRLNNLGVLEEFYRVTFNVSDNTVQSVDIAKSDYTADFVKAAIESELAEYQASKDHFS